MTTTEAISIEMNLYVACITVLGERGINTKPLVDGLVDTTAQHLDVSRREARAALKATGRI